MDKVSNAVGSRPWPPCFQQLTDPRFPVLVPIGPNSRLVRHVSQPFCAVASCPHFRLSKRQDIISGAKAQRTGLDRLVEDARLTRFDCVCVWKLDRFGRSLVDCLNNPQAVERYGVRFIAVTQGLDTDHNNPVSRFMLQVLGAAAEFERTLIVECSRAGQARYRRDYEAGKIGKTVHSRSGKNLPPHRPKRIFDRGQVVK